MSGSIQVLMDAGIDAYSNLYDIQLQFPSICNNLSYPPSSDTVGNSYSVRAMSFQPPELSLGEYQTSYKGVQMTRPTPKITGERIFKIQFRMDSNYYLYKDLLKWKHIWVDPSGEANIQVGGLADTTGNDEKYGTVLVSGYNATTSVGDYSNFTPELTNVRATFTFYQVICNKVGTPNYQRSASDAVTIDAEFIFGRMQESRSNKEEGGAGILASPPGLFYA